jgi:hypothetical protein
VDAKAITFELVMAIERPDFVGTLRMEYTPLELAGFAILNSFRVDTMQALRNSITRCPYIGEASQMVGKATDPHLSGESALLRHDDCV